MNVKPNIGLYLEPSNIELARQNLKQFAWARQAFEQWKRQCEQWLEISEEQIYSCVLGMKDEVFAYGISGCPACGTAFPMEPAKQHGMFSSINELPAKKITCPSCRAVMPSDAFPDSGAGLEIGSKAYYLIGMWNFYYAGELLGGVRNHEGLVTKLTYLYMLTGDVRYAKRAIVILDAFAAINTGSIGPRDFTAFGSEFEIGRLHMLTSIVHRIKLFLAQAYDWLGGLNGLLDVPSPALEHLGLGGTIRSNIEAMLNDYMLTEPGGPYYDLKDGNLTNLQNHESDGVRAMLAVGLALGRDDYCEWGRTAVEAYFYNALGRDGMYYEGSYGYSLFTGTIFLDIALLALRASTKEQLEAFHPFACDRFFRFAVENPLDMLCHGHLPSYGDWGKDSFVGRTANPELLLEAYRAALYFYQFAPSNELRDRARKIMLQVYPSIQERLGIRGIDLFFRHPQEAAALPEIEYALPKHNTVMGQAGIGIIRGAEDAAVFMRLGPNLTHAHDDVLACQFYDCGKEISADIGYGIYGTNAHLGWGSKAIAHNTVVVNGDSMLRSGQLFKPFAGGEFTWLQQEKQVSAMEGRAPRLYGIDDYRRMLAVASLTNGQSYVVDFFYVEGAETTDYAFHAFHEESTLQLRGTVEKPALHWTLAGVDSQQKLYYDKPGLSLGERLTTGETFSELLEGEEARLWTPEPNNGYGFIYGVKEHEGAERFVEASWAAKSGTKLTWIGLCESGDRIFTGSCPSLDGAAQHPIMIQRSSQAKKQYAAVFYASDANAAQAEKCVSQVSGLQAAGTIVTAIEVQLADGCTDYWVYSPGWQAITVSVRGQDWLIRGRSAWMRLDAGGEVMDGTCLCAESMRYGKYEKNGSAERWMRIVRVDEKESAVWIENGEAAFNPGKSCAFAKIRPQGFDQSSIYPIQQVTQDGGLMKLHLRDSLVLSKGVVHKTESDIIQTLYPLPLGADAMGGGERDTPFRGRWMKGQKGGLAEIVAIPELKRIRAHISVPFADGEAFEILELLTGFELAFI
ncbi:heparinase II/III domain-containing protein [Paenibacillus sp. IITD108]|uniref:heparinase II/III domain-containing protein n=1 Tax=Paenibacillus sp. IITD108 TaxID=3116649 RepID=UPI002F42FA0F